jgi:16S rRNA (uracil1498-N3)-methyltransferase
VRQNRWPPIEYPTMSDHWLYSENLPAQPTDWAVEGPEAQHAQVKRLRRGEHIHLFNGRGVIAVAEVIEAGRQTLCVRIVRLQTETPRLPEMTVAVCQPKGDRLDWMLEKLTELAVARIMPLECERSVAHARLERADRWQRRLVEAAKQAHVAWLPTIEPSSRLPDLLAQIWRFTHVLAADTVPDALPIAQIIGTVGPQSRPIVLIGPEGGFSDAERQLMRQAGSRFVTLGSTILRTETAAIVAAGCLLCMADPASGPQLQEHSPVEERISPGETG